MWTPLQRIKILNHNGDSIQKNHTLGGDSIHTNHTLGGDSIRKRHTFIGNSIMKKHTLIGDSDGCLNTDAHSIGDLNYN